MGYIYKITNIINGMNYVGQTIQNLQERWKQHRKIGSNCIYLKRAFEKYGIANFTFTMICVCFDEDLNKFEIQYMKSLNSMVPNGYNLKTGGSSGKHHEETKKKISIALQKTHYQIGRPISEESKKKMSITLRNKSRSTKILQYDLNHNLIKVFISFNDASRQTGFPTSTIRRCAKYNTINRGFIWKRE
jgi:group I intron endonuclease